MSISSSLQNYQRLRDQLYHICMELAKLTKTTELSIIEDSRLESWIVLGMNEIASSHYQLHPLAQSISAHADLLYKPFRVAVMGEFSRGKSTLINALLGKELLVSDFRPNTAVRTTIRASTKQHIRVHFLSGQEPFVEETDDILHALAAVTSDASSGDNQQGLLMGTRKSLAQEYKEVEVFADIQFLREREIELIDTPGLGSVFESHQAVAQSIISSVDMVLYIAQYDPGISGDDIDFLLSTREQKDRFRFLLTKRDRVKTPEKLQEMLGFVQDTLREKVGIEHPYIYPVAAISALNGHYAESGIPEAIVGIDNGLVTIVGTRRIQEALRFITTCIAWLDIALYREAQNVEKLTQIQNQRFDTLSFRTKQIQHQQNVIHIYIQNSLKTLYTELNESSNELLYNLQYTTEMVIDRLRPEEVEIVGQRVIEALQTEVNRWFQTKQKYGRDRVANILEHIYQLVTLSPNTSQKMSVQVRSTSIPVNAPALLLLVSNPSSGLISILMKIGVNSALKSMRTRYKQRLLIPIPNQQISLYQIVLNGITTTLMEQQQPRHISIQGIRGDLGTAYIQMCKSFEAQLESFASASLQPHFSAIAEEREKLLRAQEVIKQQKEELSRKRTQLETIKQKTTKLEQESNNIT
jgi:predicted GTPase